MSTTNIMEGETSPSEALKIIRAHLVRPLFFLLRGLSTKKRCRKGQTNKQKNTSKFPKSPRKPGVYLLSGIFKVTFHKPALGAKPISYVPILHYAYPCGGW